MVFSFPPPESPDRGRSGRQSAVPLFLCPQKGFVFSVFFCPGRLPSSSPFPPPGLCGSAKFFLFFSLQGHSSWAVLFVAGGGGFFPPLRTVPFLPPFSMASTYVFFPPRYIRLFGQPPLFNCPPAVFSFPFSFILPFFFVFVVESRATSFFFCGAVSSTRRFFFPRESFFPFFAMMNGLSLSPPGQIDLPRQFFFFFPCKSVPPSFFFFLVDRLPFFQIFSLPRSILHKRTTIPGESPQCFFWSSFFGVASVSPPPLPPKAPPPFSNVRGDRQVHFPVSFFSDQVRKPTFPFSPQRGALPGFPSRQSFFFLPLRALALF